MWCFQISCSLVLNCCISPITTFFFFSTFTPEFCLLKDKVKRFQEKEDLRNLLLEAAEYSVSGSGNRSCYWGQHGSLLASWGLLPYTPSFAVKDPCLTLLISMLEDIILNLIVLSSPLSLLWQALPSWSSLPVVESTLLSFSLCCGSSYHIL